MRHLKPIVNSTEIGHPGEIISFLENQQGAKPSGKLAGSGEAEKGTVANRIESESTNKSESENEEVNKRSASPRSNGSGNRSNID